jgi:hypothetical protein
MINKAVKNNKSNYCNCNFPLIRTSENGNEYCGICSRNIEVEIEINFININDDKRTKQ